MSMTPMSTLALAALTTIAQAATGCVQADALDGDTEALAPVALAASDGSGAKQAPTAMDLVARYFPEEARLEVIEGYYDQAIQALEDHPGIEPLPQEILVALIERNVLMPWQGQRLCENEHYKVYEHSTCGFLHGGYVKVGDEEHMGGGNTRIRKETVSPYRTCMYCETCDSYCVEIKDEVVGTYEDFYNYQTDPSYTAPVLRDACSVE